MVYRLKNPSLESAYVYIGNCRWICNPNEDELPVVATMSPLPGRSGLNCRLCCHELL